MRVIHVVPSIAEEASGPSYSVVQLCKSLIAQKLGVTLAALDWAPMPLPPSFLKTFAQGWGPRKLGRSPAMKRWLYEQVQGNKVDLLHNHGMWQMNAVYPGWAVNKSTIKLVVSPRGAFSEWAMTHGSITKNWFWPLFQRSALGQASCFHATAISEYEDIRRLGFRQPVAIIPNGIDIPEQISKVHGGKRTLLFLGRIHPKKGLDLLLPAWRAVQDRFPEWRLRIIGPDNGGYLSEMRRLAAKLSLARVEFCGELVGVQKWHEYQQADLFVLSTYSENFGMTVAEALASGTPAIVSKGAPWDGLLNHQAGWWIDVGLDPLVACLKVALSQQSSRLEEMGLRGRNWMENDFSWARIGVQMADTYRWLMDKSLPVPAWVRVH